MSYCRPAAGGVRLAVRVIPRAHAAAIGGIRDDALLVRLTAPPVDDAANRNLVAFLASRLHVPASAVRITSGARSRHKIVEITGITAEACRRALDPPP